MTKEEIAAQLQILTSSLKSIMDSYVDQDLILTQRIQVINNNLVSLSDQISSLELTFETNISSLRAELNSLLDRVALLESSPSPEPEPTPEPEPIPDPSTLRTLIVGPGGFSTIQAAIEFARAIPSTERIRIAVRDQNVSGFSVRRSNMIIEGDGIVPTVTGGVVCNGSGGTPTEINDIVIQNFNFVDNGLALLRGGRNWTIENCSISRAYVGIALQGFDGPWQNITLKRLKITDCRSISRSQGMYIDNTHGLYLEKVLVDNCGYPDIFSHNVYIQSNCSDVRVSNCFFSRAGSHGIQLRPGGIVEDCIFVSNPIQLLLGGGGDQPVPGGVDVVARGNKLYYASDISTSQRRGWGIVAENANRIQIENNLVAYATGTGDVQAISLDYERSGATVVIRDNHVVSHGRIDHRAVNTNTSPVSRPTLDELKQQFILTILLTV